MAELWAGPLHRFGGRRAARSSERGFPVVFSPHGHRQQVGASGRARAGPPPRTRSAEAGGAETGNARRAGARSAGAVAKAVSAPAALTEPSPAGEERRRGPSPTAAARAAASQRPLRRAWPRFPECPAARSGAAAAAARGPARACPGGRDRPHGGGCPPSGHPPPSVSHPRVVHVWAPHTRRRYLSSRDGTAGFRPG